MQQPTFNWKPIAILVGAIICAVFVAILLPNQSVPDYQFVLQSNYEGSQILVSRKDEKVRESNRTSETVRDWRLFIGDAQLNLTRFVTLDEYRYGTWWAQFSSTTPHVIFYDAFNVERVEREGRQKEYGIWRKDINSPQPAEKIFEHKEIAWFFMLENQKILFIGPSLTEGGFYHGYDWHVYDPKAGVQQISHNQSYLFPQPFIINNAVAGFVDKYRISDKKAIEAGAIVGDYYLSYVVLKQDAQALQALERIKQFVVASKSAYEPDIRCDTSGDVCFVTNVVVVEGGRFEQELFLLDAAGNKKIDINIKHIKNYTVSGDGKHLFVAGRKTVDAADFFLEKYSCDASGNWKLALSVNPVADVQATP